MKYLKSSLPTEKESKRVKGERVSSWALISHNYFEIFSDNKLLAIVWNDKILKSISTNWQNSHK